MYMDKGDATIYTDKGATVQCTQYHTVRHMVRHMVRHIQCEYEPHRKQESKSGGGPCP